MAWRVERVWPNGCEGATGPRDPPDRSKLALHRTKQKLYVAVKELELSNSIECLECAKQTENLPSVYFDQCLDVEWYGDLYTFIRAAEIISSREYCWRAANY